MNDLSGDWAIPIVIAVAIFFFIMVQMEKAERRKNAEEAQQEAREEAVPIPLAPRSLPDDLVNHCVEAAVKTFEALSGRVPKGERAQAFDEIAGRTIGAYAYNWQVELGDQVSYFIGDTAQRLESRRETLFGPWVVDDEGFFDDAFGLYLEKGEFAFEDWRDFNEKRRHNPSYDGQFGNDDYEPAWQALIDEARRLIEDRATP